MLLSILFLTAAATAEAPVVVTGHAWAPFISPMGEPFRARTASDDTLAIWFAKADTNGDGALTREEMLADANRFFAALDTDHDGQLDPDEVKAYEWEVAPQIQVNSRTLRSPGEPPRKVATKRERDEKEGGFQGAARYGLLNMPEPVAAADTDFNRSITLAEFRQAASVRFQLLDKGRQGRLTLPQLEALRSAMIAARRSKRHGDDADERVANSLPVED